MNYDFVLRVADCRLLVTELVEVPTLHRLPITDYRSLITDYLFYRSPFLPFLPITDYLFYLFYRSPITDHRLPFLPFLPITDYRIPITFFTFFTDYRLRRPLYPRRGAIALLDYRLPFTFFTAYR
jgi:hypothetical protein